jgi:xanthine dehydrogenase accessory factor
MSVIAMESSVHAQHGTHTFYFCSPGCRAAFLAEPERYAPVG